MSPDSSRWRAALGTGLACLAFAGALWALDRALGWPASWATLGIALGAAWFAGALAGGLVSRSRLTTGAPLALALALAVSTLALGWPWPELSLGEGQPRVVWFRTEAMFYVWETENGVPIENVVLDFPMPHIENDALLSYKGWWTLYWIDVENRLWPQLLGNEDGEILANYGLYGERKDFLKVIEAFIQPTSRGPKYWLKLDRLYPREALRVWFYSRCELDDEGNVLVKRLGENRWEDVWVKASYEEVTLRDEIPGYENEIALLYYHSNDPNFENSVPIDLSCWAELRRKVGGVMVDWDAPDVDEWVRTNYEVVEVYQRERRYYMDTAGWYFMYLTAST
jgi:hypothetical protein